MLCAVVLLQEPFLVGTDAEIVWDEATEKQEPFLADRSSLVARWKLHLPLTLFVNDIFWQDTQTR